MWCTSVTRGVRSHSGVRNVIPLTTSSTTSASRASPRADRPRRAREDRRPRAHVVQLEPRRRPLDRGRARVRARDDRHAMAPLEPVRHLTEQVRARPAALRVRPVAVGEEQDVGHRANDRSRCPAYTGSPMSFDASRLAAAAVALALRPRHRPRAGRGRRPVLGPVRRRAGAAGDAHADPAPRPPRRPRRRPSSPPPRPPRRRRSATPAGPTLPYTGVDGWPLALGGALLLGAGLTLRARLREPD